MAGRPTAGIAGPFPNGLRALRAKTTLRQEDLAAHLSVTTSAYGKLERGQIRLRSDQILTLAKIFKCHPAAVLVAMSDEEREALQILTKANKATRYRMLQMLKMLAEPLPIDTTKAA